MYVNSYNSGNAVEINIKILYEKCAGAVPSRVGTGSLNAQHKFVSLRKNKVTLRTINFSQTVLDWERKN